MGGRHSSSSSPHSTQRAERREPNASHEILGKSGIGGKNISSRPFLAADPPPGPGNNDSLGKLLSTSGSAQKCPRAVPGGARNPTEAPKSCGGTAGLGAAIPAWGERSLGGSRGAPEQPRPPPRPPRRRPRCSALFLGWEWSQRGSGPGQGGPGIWGGFSMGSEQPRGRDMSFLGGHVCFGIFWGVLEFSPLPGGRSLFSKPPQTAAGRGRGSEPGAIPGRRSRRCRRRGDAPEPPEPVSPGAGSDRGRRAGSAAAGEGGHKAVAPSAPPKTGHPPPAPQNRGPPPRPRRGRFCFRFASPFTAPFSAHFGFVFPPFPAAARLLPRRSAGPRPAGDPRRCPQTAVDPQKCPQPAAGAAPDRGEPRTGPPSPGEPPKVPPEPRPRS